jgi:hypothetical protein
VSPPEKLESDLRHSKVNLYLNISKYSSDLGEITLIKMYTKHSMNYLSCLAQATRLTSIREFSVSNLSLGVCFLVYFTIRGQWYSTCGASDTGFHVVCVTMNRVWICDLVDHLYTHDS